jgi:putative CocE/NonD family hydrolase
LHDRIDELMQGMRIDWDVPIRMEDGAVLRADVFRPVEEGRYPVIMTHGPYAKGLPFQQGYPGMWKALSAKYRDAVAGSSNKYQNWETVDPEKWVPEGYVCVRVDSRGAGRSPGHLDIFSPRETRDYYECIEWAGIQRWSNGKVGLGTGRALAKHWPAATKRTDAELRAIYLYLRSIPAIRNRVPPPRSSATSSSKADRQL